MYSIPDIKREEILFRTHNFGELIPASTSLSDSQKSRLMELKTRTKPLTDNMVIELAGLIEKQKAYALPDLSESGKAIVLDMFNQMVRGTYRLSSDSKETRKGNEMESFAIARIAKVMGWGVMLNSNKSGEVLQDEIGIMHPDAIKRSIGIGLDSKCPYEDKNLNLFKDALDVKNYIWQAKRGAMMAGFDGWHIGYSLENAPESIVISEAGKLWNEGMNEGEVTDSFIDEVRQMHNFDHLPDWARVKVFTVKLEEKDRDTARKYASIARNYFFELLEKYKIHESKYKPLTKN